MLSFPNCKINLGLYVTNKRTDGYHDLETVFFPLPLTDVLEIIETKEAVPKLFVTGKTIDAAPETNLVRKAWQLMREQFGERVPVFEIYLHKVLPMGAGLGGGSADGSFMLKMLNEYCGLGLDGEVVSELALQLGSDCPFFLNNTACFAAGRGEKMEPVALDLSEYSLQLICPKVHVSTRDAFSMLQPQKAGFDLRGLDMLPVINWKEAIRNDFEAPVFRQYPVLGKIKEQLYEQGAVYASMSGSGSAVFGLFPKKQKASVKADVEFEEFYLEDVSDPL